MAIEDHKEGKVEGLAEQVARELLEAMPNLKTARPSERIRAIFEVFEAKESSFAKLVDVFIGDPSFGHLRGGWIQRCGGDGMIIRSHTVPCQLISSIIDGRSAKSFAKEARTFAESRTSITELFTPLAGVTVAEAVNLSESIDLLPWADVPAVSRKTVFESDAVYEAFDSNTLIPSRMRAVANSAVRIRSAECHALFSSLEEAKASLETSTSEVTNRTEKIPDIVRCIAVSGKHVVAALGSWAQFDQGLGNDIIGTGHSSNVALYDIAVYQASRKPVGLDQEEIARLFRRFEEFKSSEKDVMRVSIDRLNQALRRQNIVDQVIDLGIALEVMLLHSIGTRDRGELKFRSSVRGAMFLGGEKQQRLKAFKILKAAYDLRSKAVHSGNLISKKNEQPPAQIVESASDIYANIAWKLIELGSFPDWEADYVVGGQ